MHTLTFSKCTYRNVEYISIEKGGKDSEAALKATATRVKRCMQVGEPWSKAHPVRDRVEFVNLEQGWSETFEKSWSQHVTQQKVRATTGSIQSSAAKQSEHVTSPTAQKIGAHLKRRPR